MKKNRALFCNILKNNFCESLLFGNFISRKSGQKCCRFGQNGKPLTEDTVEKFLNTMKMNATRKIHWKAIEDHTKLVRCFQFRNVFLLTDFIKQLYDLDYKTNVQQIPNITVKDGELFKIELNTPSLKGLSFKDLQLAAAIDSLDYEKFGLIPIENEANFRREIRTNKIEETKIKNETLGEGTWQERTKIKNKYDELAYYENQSTKEISNQEFDCSKGEGCPCKSNQLNKYELI